MQQISQISQKSTGKKNYKQGSISDKVAELSRQSTLVFCREYLTYYFVIKPFLM